MTDEHRVLLPYCPLTIETTPHFERAVHGEQAETMILDLSDVYIDSVGLGPLVAITPRTRKLAFPGPTGVTP